MGEGGGGGKMRKMKAVVADLVSLWGQVGGERAGGQHHRHRLADRGEARAESSGGPAAEGRHRQREGESGSRKPEPGRLHNRNNLLSVFQPPLGYNISANSSIISFVPGLQSRTVNEAVSRK